MYQAFSYLLELHPEGKKKKKKILPCWSLYFLWHTAYSFLITTIYQRVWISNKFLYHSSIEGTIDGLQFLLLYYHWQPLYKLAAYFLLEILWLQVTFKSLIHFEFIFVYGVRKQPNLIFLSIAVRFSQYHLLKRLSFSHWIFLPP